MMFHAGLAALWLSASVPPLVLAVGTNQGTQDSPSTLHYADDDAASAVELFAGPKDRWWLLTALDAASQERFSALKQHARAPTRSQLEGAVVQMVQRVAEDRQRGEEPQVVVWLTGHGAFDARGQFYVAMQDFQLTAQALENLVLKPLAAAHRIHVVLDACHAEAMVKARAELVAASPEEVARAPFIRSHFSQPQVGFLWAASTHEKTFEWEEIQGGVFSALVRSGLRGAANANQDLCVTYPELTAYVSSALQGIALPQARPTVNAVAPRVDGQAALSCAGWFSNTRPLTTELGALGPLHVEDHRGNWLAGGWFEPHQTNTLWLPDTPQLSVHAQQKEWELVAGPEGLLAVNTEPVPAATRTRGAVERAVKEGLFSVSYGSHYLKGFEAARTLQTSAPEQLQNGKRSWGPALAAVAGAPTVVAAVALGAALMGAVMTGYLAVRWQTSTLQRPATEFQRAGILTGVLTGLALGAAVLGGVVALGLWTAAAVAR